MCATLHFAQVKYRFRSIYRLHFVKFLFVDNKKTESIVRNMALVVVGRHSDVFGGHCLRGNLLLHHHNQGRGRVFVASVTGVKSMRS